MRTLVAWTSLAIILTNCDAKMINNELFIGKYKNSIWEKKLRDSGAPLSLLDEVRALPLCTFSHQYPRTVFYINAYTPYRSLAALFLRLQIPVWDLLGLEGSQMPIGRWSGFAVTPEEIEVAKQHQARAEASQAWRQTFASTTGSFVMKTGSEDGGWMAVQQLWEDDPAWGKNWVSMWRHELVQDSQGFWKITLPYNPKTNYLSHAQPASLTEPGRVVATRVMLWDWSRYLRAGYRHPPLHLILICILCHLLQRCGTWNGCPTMMPLITLSLI